jgi:hypothetical protein
MNNIIAVNIKLVRAKLDLLEKSVMEKEFNSEENKEDALDEIESAVIALDDLEDILDRDNELANMRKAIG